MNRSLALLVILFTAVFSAACAREKSSTVDQSRIYTDYRMTYDAQTQKLQAQAAFWFGGPTGTSLELDGESHVDFDGTRLGGETTLANSAQYGRTLTKPNDGELYAAHRFTYTNNSGTVFENTVTVPRTPTSQYPTTSVSATTYLTVAWTTSDAVGNDRISLEIDRSKSSIPNAATGTSTPTNNLESQTLTVYDTGTDPARKSGLITVESANLSRLKTGVYDARICRTKEKDPDSAPSAGGMISTSSCGVKTAITIKP